MKKISERQGFKTVEAKNIKDALKIVSSKEKKISTTELTSNITKKFHEDCDYLKCEKPSFEPKATENIPLI